MLMNSGRQARLNYLANGFRVVSPGDHVICAISGVEIPLDNLKYWSVARQEPYAGAVEATQAERGG